MDIFHVPVGRAALKRARHDFYVSWAAPTTTFQSSRPSNRVASVLRFKRREILDAIHLPISFTNITALWVVTNGTRDLLGDIATKGYALSVLEVTAIRRLEAVISAATLRFSGLEQAVLFRKSLEQDLAVLFPEFVPPRDASTCQVPVVLCVMNTSLYTGSGFLCYVNSCTVSPHQAELGQQKVSTSRVVCLPHWVYKLFVVLSKRLPLSWAAAQNPALESIVSSLRTADISACSEIPASSILEAALALWSPLREDLYHDVDHAIAAARRLV